MMKKGWLTTPYSIHILNLNFHRDLSPVVTVTTTMVA